MDDDSSERVPGPAGTGTSLSDDALVDAVRAMAATVDAATSRLVALIVELDERGLWADEGHRSCAHWLSCRCGIALGAAREQLRVGRALRELPRTAAAFADGTLSYSKARAITRVADPGNEDFLLSVAEHGSASHLERLVARFRGSMDAARREAERDLAARLADERRLSHHYDEDGMLVLRARLPPEEGALVVQALERAVEQLGEDRPIDPADPHEDVSAETPAIDAPARTAPDRLDARRADALALIARASLARGCAHARRTADRHHVSVVVDAATLAGADAGEAAECHVPHGPRLAFDTVRRLCCDGAVSGILERDGEALSIGRRTRAIPPSIRRALERRDGGCRFPGCTAHRFVDGHHIRHWADGGETSLENLVLVCGHHHRLLHEGGYHVERTSRGAGRHARVEHVFRTPNGHVIEARAARTSPATPPPPRPASDWEWDGSVMDWSIALDELEHPTPAATPPLTAAALLWADGGSHHGADTGAAGRLRGDVFHVHGHDPG